MVTIPRQLIVFTILFMFLALIVAREVAAAAVQTQGGKFAGMVMIPAGEFTMGRTAAQKTKRQRTNCFCRTSNR